MKYQDIILLSLFATPIQSQDTDKCAASPCNSEQFRTCPGLSKYRRFCDIDGNVLGDGKSRTICAPCGIMDQLYLANDYCGDCVEPTPSDMTSVPTNSPIAAPITIAPVTAAPISSEPLTFVTEPPFTSAPIVSQDSERDPGLVSLSSLTSPPVTQPPVA
mmetsp:Transcript_6029/g.6930  ORF Transcript_6029/g.6930 Transcript_6029/m.6930 type:complete len:160 (+) Transcript_6029:59-538(+)|eukprot:CAMPEP_0194144142 /NCGR_PEP_ID=MMETSP0152-20130528/13221_1 /TAXON_ID=1049557 /ORGANISM="Thalassiothrix antarctica, Strain L6-D1" /LENGTH=159 /DNA_ID=CAMNT_0038843859 /DNA_START=74 /DNA_END=553 /DNA_ORIENTATION=-